ncbi:MAG: histidinol-phosphatase HisJ family protein [Clostridia bacterium]|nr:histidinol-phosphatase HisJ family protein [Clostridia bacterium]
MNDCLLVDTHLHSDNSPDGNHSCMFICENAVSMGLKAISITDHCETDVYYQDHYDRSTMQSYFEILKAKEAYRGKLVVLRGIELGEATYNAPLAEKIISRFDYDIVIGSIHNLRETLDFYFMESFEERQAKAYLHTYFDELIGLADWGKFDTMAHITYPLRYFYAKSGIYIDMCEYKSQTDELFSLLAEKELALEINTGGLRQPLRKLSPEADLVKRFRELGGKYITFASDAHYVSDLAYGFSEAMEAAKYAGFTSCVFYQQHNPMEIPFA